MKFFGQSDGIIPWGRCLFVKFVLVLALLLVTRGAVAANPPVTLHLKDVSVAELLRRIEAQGQYTFAYNNADIDLTKIVSIDADAWPVERVVSKCIPGVQVSVERNKVILTPVRSAENLPRRRWPIRPEIPSSGLRFSSKTARRSRVRPPA